MNYEKYFIAITILGETGNGIIVTRQEKSQIKGLKIFPGGNQNITIPKKKFKQMITRGNLEIIEKMPKDIYKEVLTTWTNNKEEVEFSS